MSDATVKLQIGRELTSGLGSGVDPDLGRKAAEDSIDRLRQVLRGSDLVFVTAGEGGGTGTGAAPVIARVARELGALTVGIVTMPFGFEGRRRTEAAQAGLDALQGGVDTLIVVPNDRLLEVLERGVSMVDAFRMADDVLRQGVQGICDLITRPGVINLDFADVRTVMAESGSALMGIGMATGPARGREAARRALDSPLIGQRIRGATGVLLSIMGPAELTLQEVTEAAEAVREAAAGYANIIFGTSVDETLGDQLWVTVIATGFERQDGARAAASPSARATARRCGSSRSTTISTSRPSCATRKLRVWASAARGAIAAGHPVTAEVGAEVLRAGGSAVDACVAAAFASWVAEPALTGPGGGGFLVALRRGARRRPLALDCFVAVPGQGHGGGPSRRSSPTSSTSAPGSRPSSSGRGRAPCPASRRASRPRIAASAACPGPSSRAPPSRSRARASS